MKVLFMANIPSPYRVQFFQELSAYCDLTVTYEKKQAADRNDKWKADISDKGYHEIYLKSVFEKSDSAFCPEITKYIDKGLYDIFVVGMYSTPTGMWAIRALKKRKIPFLMNCDGGFIAKKESFVKRTLKTKLIGSAAYWLSTGKAGDEYLKYYGAEEWNICRYHFSSVMRAEVLPEIIPRNKKGKYREKLNMPETRIIISVGQLIYRKGYDILLKAAKDLPDEWGIYIIGGRPNEEYKTMLEELELEHVHFIDFKKKEELRDYYLAADCMVLPTREDIWGLVINEAMAFGLPVVTTDRCAAGLEMIRENGNGKIVPVGHARKLSEAIKEVICSENWEDMSRTSLSVARLYTIEQMAEEHGRIFEKLINV